MDIASATQTLRLFNEKADKLQRLSFTKKVLHEKVEVRLSWKRGAETKIQRLGPDEESIDAFVLTFRFFIQKNEKIRFKTMVKLYSSLPIDSGLIQRFKKAADVINQLFDSYTHVGIDGRRLTRRQVFNTFMWGGLAHSNNKATYDKWSKDPLLFPMLQSEFIVILAKTLGVIFEMRDINQAAMKKLEKVP